jgi:MFS transporter, MHS family, citrate/tricarballylate:H+ symporter
MLSPEQRKEKIKAVIRAGTGNFLELYDFLVYAYFATYIARAFFPTQNEFMSLMLALGTYGVASIARPFGAVFLGSYMDRYGRRKGLLVTLSLMAVGTASLAFTPSYDTIGIAAPIIITLGRLIQGFSIGVEAGGVNVYLAEIATPKNRGFYCSWQGGSQALGVVAATGLGAFLTATLTTEQMQAYGWRIPLIVGCGIIPILFWLRRSLQETEYFENSTHARSTGEVLRILADHWVILTIGVMLTILNTTMFYFVNTYTPTYGIRTLQLDPLGTFMVALVVGTVTFILLPVGGMVSDRIGRLPTLIGVPALVLVTSYFAMAWLDAAPSFERLLAVELWLAALYAMYAGTLVPLLTEIIPGKARSSGYSIILSLANGLFGSFTPAIATFMIEMTGDRASPALWLSACAALSLIASAAAWRFAFKPALRAAALAE